MKHERLMSKAFGINEYGFVDLPNKISSGVIVKVQFIETGCPICPPNRGCNRRRDRDKSWKAYRKTQWK